MSRPLTKGQRRVLEILGSRHEARGSYWEDFEGDTVQPSSAIALMRRGFVACRRVHGDRSTIDSYYRLTDLGRSVAKSYYASVAA